MRLALLLLATGLSAMTSGTPGTPVGAGQDVLDKLQVWVDRARAVPGAVDERRLEDLEALLIDVRRLREPEAEARAALELARLAGLVERVRGNPTLAYGVRLGRDAIERRLDSTTGQAWSRSLALGVLAKSAGRPDEERKVAAVLLGARRSPSALEPLLEAARGAGTDLARTAQGALEGWPDGRVHALFLDLARTRTAASRAVGRHFTLAREHLDVAVREALAAELARRFQSEDWRDAARARDLVPAFETEAVAPILIAALATWDARTRAGSGSVRIRTEINDELQRLSGRSIAPDAVRWSRWLEALRSGQVLLPEDLIDAGGDPSRATFFGLRVDTDRVLFVVDGSSSMKTRFGTGERTRHQEAIEQLIGFLERSGEETRFSVALFGEKGQTWRRRMSSADSGARQSARRWLESKEPQGRTLLFEGLRAGLELDGRGHLIQERIEADTVIVLCDGATTEGPGWVADWLAGENEEARLVFHCVQIGHQGNGTLEALAAGSGGRFLRVL